jgi:hypothetical protein
MVNSDLRYANRVSFFTHEMLHSMGLPHAHGPAVPDAWSNNLTGAKLSDLIDVGDTHKFGSLNWWDYGDCWSIMGCGYWTTPYDPYPEVGPDLGATQRYLLGWLPKRFVTYEGTGDMSVTLAPANQPELSADPLMVKIPIGDAGYYTVEYQATTKWSAGIGANGQKPAILIHEVHLKPQSSYDEPNASYLIGRTIYGTWSQGQVFYDPDNHVRVSIDSLGDKAEVTLSSGGDSDGGVISCPPAGYTPMPRAADYTPTASIILLPGATFTTGVPVRLAVRASDPALAPNPVPNGSIRWYIGTTPSSSPVTTGSVFSHTFTSKGTYTIRVEVDGRTCLSASASADITVDAPSTIR